MRILKADSVCIRVYTINIDASLCLMVVLKGIPKNSFATGIHLLQVLFSEVKRRSYFVSFLSLVSTLSCMCLFSMNLPQSTFDYYSCKMYDVQIQSIPLMCANRRCQNSFIGLETFLKQVNHSFNVLMNSFFKCTQHYIGHTFNWVSYWAFRILNSLKSN